MLRGEDGGEQKEVVAVVVVYLLSQRELELDDGRKVNQRGAVARHRDIRLVGTGTVAVESLAE